jgi:hypothetical protein
MSEPVVPFDGTSGDAGEQTGSGGPAGRRVKAGRWVRRRGVRWVAAGAAVVVLGGTVAVAVHRHDEGPGRMMADRVPAGPRGAVGPGGKRFAKGEGRRVVEADGRRGGKGEVGRDGRPVGPGRSGGAALAPAPLPAVAAQQAVEKAAGAVPGGRVESLAVVAEQGGGSAWQAVVVGTDGVRHQVTIDGAGGSITGNTVVGAAR